MQEDTNNMNGEMFLFSDQHANMRVLAGTPAHVYKAAEQSQRAQR